MKLYLCIDKVPDSSSAKLLIWGDLTFDPFPWLQDYTILRKRLVNSITLLNFLYIGLLYLSLLLTT
jgi:hypothetical protein